MYNVTLFRNTGLNAVNKPDQPSLLNNAQSFTVAALDIYQAKELTQFSIRATYDLIEDVDFLLLQNDDPNRSDDYAYYSVENVTMTSKDVAVLSVTMSYILTAGGIYNLEFLDGITERHHVDKADDDFGAFDEADPYIVPAQPLEIDTEIPDFVGNDSDIPVTILNTTINLYDIYRKAKNQADLKGLDYASDNGNVVTVPTVTPGGPLTVVHMYRDTNNYYTTWLPNTTIYIPSWLTVFPDKVPSSPTAYEHDYWMPAALAYVRSLGLESVILAQYSIPKFMLDADFQNWAYLPDDGSGVPVGFDVGLVANLEGKFKDYELSNLEFERSYNHTVQNKRLFYGENCKYYITSVASGNSAEFLPEQIRQSDQTDAPTIDMRVDPRPDGMPYFRFHYFKGDGNNEDMFFRNAVKGLNWQSVPLVFQGASGSLLNQYRYDAQRAAADESYRNQQLTMQSGMIQSRLNTAGNAIGAAATMIGGGLTGNAAGFIGGVGQLVDTGVNALFNEVNYEIAQEHARNSYNIARNTELQNLMIANNVVAPTVNFPISESIRDFVGNTCIVYRTHYTEEDVTRLDKILNMYGYRHTTPITRDLLTNRSKFNYIRAHGVSVKTPYKPLPKWMRDGIAAEFEAGFRLWHVLPDEQAYTDGTNV